MSGKRGKIKWDETNLARAFRLVERGKTIRQAAKETGIPFSTLQERLKSKNTQILKCGRHTVFSKAQEDDMASQIKYLAKIFYGCTATDIKRMAYEYAEKNDVPHNFNKDTKMAGKDWLKGFMKRNNLSVRKAEGTSLNRATGFNKDEVGIFFKLLGDVMEKYNFPPRNIYNVDETGITTVPDPGKIVAEKGQKRVGSITSGERGQTVTAVCAMSASGIFVPPMLIYPPIRHSAALEADGPRGAIYRGSKNGWINEELFVDWLKHFAVHAKPSEDNHVLLILDNHSSHISLKAYEFCKSNNIVMLSLPPHGSHRIQPMDISIYGPLKTAYKQECNYFMKSDLGRKITTYDIASLFRKAFQKIATIPKAEAGFKAAGIYPFDPDVFSEEDYVAAEVYRSDNFILESIDRVRDNTTPVSQLLANEQNDTASISGSPSLLDENTPTYSSDSQSAVRSLSNLAMSEINRASFISQTNHHIPSSITADSSTVANTSTRAGETTHTIGLTLTGCMTTRTTVSATASRPTTSASVTTSGRSSSLINLPSSAKEINSDPPTKAKDLLPFPKKSIEKQTIDRKQHAIIITGTPLKEILIQKEERKQKRKEAKNKPNRKKNKITKKTTKKRDTKKKATEKSSMNPEIEINQRVQKVKKRVFQEKNSSSSESDIETECQPKRKKNKIIKKTTKKRDTKKKSTKKSSINLESEINQRVQEVKKRVLQEKNSSSSESDIETECQQSKDKKKEKIKPKEKKKAIKRVRKILSITSDSDIEMKDLRNDDDTDTSDNDDIENRCVICADYGRHNELWFRCVMCGLWAHAECTGSDTADNYICDLCRIKA